MASLMDRLRAFVTPSQVVRVSLGADAPVSVLNYTAKSLYQTQDNLQAVVNFLSNSIAQLPIKVYKRGADDERMRDRESAAAKLLWKPNEDQTAYEFMRALSIEYFVFGCVYVWVAIDPESESGYQLRIIPSEWVESIPEANAYAEQVLRVKCGSAGYVEIPKDEFVCFKTYSPGNPRGYLSPISALRQTLQEQIEAGNFRKQLWHSSGRLNAQITRPANVQPWDDETRKRFAQAFREAWGANGSKAGSIPIMEDGMKIEPFQTSFKESEWAESVKLSREAVASAYGVNPSLIWHSNTQTYASSKDNARALYAECLGPVIQMLQQRINSFLLPKVGADAGTYVVLDLTEKLKGSFEERASIYQAAVGAPWMTIDEARRDNDMPPLPDGMGSQIVTPLNVMKGPTSEYDYEGIDNQAKSEELGKTLVPLACKCGCKEQDTIEFKSASSDQENEEVADVISNFLKRQAKSVLPKIGAGAEWWDAERWNKELADDLEPVIDKIADEKGQATADKIKSEYVPELTRKYLRLTAEGRAKTINQATQKKIEKDLEEEEPDTEAVFEKAQNDSFISARSIATFASTWALTEAVHQAQSQNNQTIAKKVVLKRWVTGENPRSSHAQMDGEEVPFDADFSNGCFFPGDSDDPWESCGCNCSTVVVIR